MGNDAPASTEPTEADFVRIQQSDDFRRLRKRLRGFVFPVAAASLLWYLAYVLLAAYAKDFMSIPVIGSINVGLVLGLAQVVTTFAVTMIYVSFANRSLDPLAAEIRDEAETAGVVR
ncbi:DUF485 domain-containing protein [Leifsonia sp. H3M29-4]|uniref:DUF485 domain-containing protein n=1 Tax=Salinibacterium metalliresistens TaxID=3031321 RepID=UPI0023DC1BBA|nr:DUF485 domain-containing protein [Salinibacterium metalliresistens]MDF1477605.1 DUF485 domain-containing protein [Salinibacterium metalliresistens]